MLKYFFLIFFTFYSVSYSQSEGTDFWYILSPEFRFDLSDKFEIRLRAFEGFLLTNSASNNTIRFGRSELMVGYNHKQFDFFAYVKRRTTGEMWIGPRVDYTNRFFDNKLSIHAHYRYFTGLNSFSADHQYLVTLFDYKLTNTFRPGILGYNRHEFGSKPLVFYGPSVTTIFAKKSAVLLSYMKCLTFPKTYLTMIAIIISVN